MLHCADQWPANVDENLEGLVNVLDDVLKIMSVKEAQDNSFTSWQMRVQLSAAILNLMLVDTEVRLNIHKSSHSLCSSRQPVA